MDSAWSKVPYLRTRVEGEKKNLVLVLVCVLMTHHLNKALRIECTYLGTNTNVPTHDGRTRIYLCANEY